MVDFGAMKDKAQEFIADHDDQVKDGIKKVGDFVGNKVGHDKVDGVEDKLSGLVDKLARNPDTPEAPGNPGTPETPSTPKV